MPPRRGFNLTHVTGSCSLWGVCCSPCSHFNPETRCDCLPASWLVPAGVLPVLKPTAGRPEPMSWRHFHQLAPHGPANASWDGWKYFLTCSKSQSAQYIISTPVCSDPLRLCQKRLGSWTGPTPPGSRDQTQNPWSIQPESTSRSQQRFSFKIGF